MKKKTIPLGVTAFLLVIVPVYTHCIKISDLDLKVDASKTYEVGELIVLDASNSVLTDLDWAIFPETANFRVDGKKAYFSSMNRADYHVVLAGTDGKVVKCLILKLVHGKVIEPEEVDLFTEKLRTWLPEEYNQGTAFKLAQSFRSVATISKNSFNDLEAMLLATAYSNKVALGDDFSVWKPFLDQLSLELEVTSIAECAKKWNQIADSLESLI